MNSQFESHDWKQNSVKELEIQNKELQENNITLKLNCDQVQDELSQVGDELKLSLQKQAGLEEQLSVKEKEIASMQIELLNSKKNLEITGIAHANQDLLKNQLVDSNSKREPYTASM